jgi:hypothetical protein
MLNSDELAKLMQELKDMPKYRFKYAYADEMQVSKNLMKGIVAKHIERRNLFHGNDVHQKMLIVKLSGQPVLKIREADAMTGSDKRYGLHTITALHVFENE